MAVQDAIAAAAQAGNLQVKERGAANPFKTGSVGYTVSGKVMIDGKKHQFSGNLVEIGSKPADVAS